MANPLIPTLLAKHQPDWIHVIFFALWRSTGWWLLLGLCEKKNILLSSFNPSKFSSKCFLFHGLWSRVDLGRAWGFWTEHERMWINQKWLTLQYQNDFHTKFETLSLYLSRWFECHIFNLCNLFLTEAEKGQSKIFWKSEKIFKIDNFETNRFSILLPN